ncbi:MULTISPECIES: hypothetical protein [unclassified Rhizobium]|uniref:hypothetical protein n=1 Tax=unclassified Rhizobium TaxID=2613769 RepID=UPI001FE0A0EF|nr:MULTISPECIES: hypothetical protein [unclassified Rhizobium]
MMTSSDVAKVVYEAATDGKDQLRYLVGDDARGFVKARRDMDDQALCGFYAGTICGIVLIIWSKMLQNEAEA